MRSNFIQEQARDRVLVPGTNKGRAGHACDEVHIEVKALTRFPHLEGGR